MPSYNIKNNNKKRGKRFTKEELLEMSTYKLRNICRKYKIVKGYNKPNSREKLIELIYKYRGEKKPDLIMQTVEEGVERLQKVLDDNLHSRLDDKDMIKIPAKIRVYKELGVCKEDSYQVIATNKVGESNVLLVDGNNALCGIFNLKKYNEDDDRYYLQAKKQNLFLDDLRNKNYNLLFFNQDESDYLYDFYYSEKGLPPKKLDYYKLPIIDFEVKELQETESTLCIDFGTSNTTAGAYLDNNYISDISNNDLLNQKIRVDNINFVKFPVVKDRQEDWIKIIPTIVYVKDCSDPQNIEYMFGHLAKHRRQRNDYSGNASVFQGIKKWMTNHKKKIEICDEAGNLAVIERGEIIRAYIQYVVKRAEQQFKCKFKNIHISSPVKLKEQFIATFQELIDEYNIEKKNVLDEGISVLYNTIANLIQKNKFHNGHEYKALVIDCGGGTTDLSTCKFRIEKGSISYKVNIETGFENGDTNFGGNNITYRIMQFMKIAFVSYYTNSKKDIDIDSLISVPDGDIFRKVDQSGLEEIYGNLEEKYKEAEAIIPTRYKEYENKTAAEYQKVKNNFYFLWQIAENMKKDFFRKTNILRNKFDSSDFSKQDTDLHITSLNRWNISVYNKQGMLEVKDEFPDIVFNIKEIKKLIKGDIYEIVSRFLEGLYESRRLMEYSIIKLTGQSCKIDIFKEALKEFVPGRSIEFKQRKNKSLELKLACLKGVIKYIKAKKMGNIEVNITNQPPIMPYFITTTTFTGEEKILIEKQISIDKAKGNILKPLSTSKVKFYVKDDQAEVKNEYIYRNNLDDYQKIKVREVLEDYKGKISQAETDKIGNDQIKFFIFTSNTSWGFFVVPIARIEDQLHIGKKEYFSFDDNLSELDFFDGLK